MAAIQLADAAASALADALTTLVDTGTGPGTIEVYSGTLPTDLVPAGGATLLATFTLVDPAAASAVAGVAAWDFSTPIDATVAATGEAGWFRVLDSAATLVFGGDVAVTGASLNFSSTSWVAGGTVSLTTGTVTEPTAALT